MRGLNFLRKNYRGSSKVISHAQETALLVSRFGGDVNQIDSAYLIPCWRRNKKLRAKISSEFDPHVIRILEAVDHFDASSENNFETYLKIIFEEPAALVLVCDFLVMYKEEQNIENLEEYLERIPEMCLHTYNNISTEAVKALCGLAA